MMDRKRPVPGSGCFSFLLSALLGTLPFVGCGGSNGISISNGNSTSPSATSSLIVSDTHQDRVLIYDAPFSNGQSATIVLGQTSFTTETSGTTANTMFYPGAIALDNAGNLYVADGGNCRVIRIPAPFSNGMSADLEFGQPNLNSGTCPTSASATSLGKSIPLGNGVFGVPVMGVSSDSAGNLWVADSEFHRVLEYKPPFTNGMAAVLVIGQADLSSGSPNQGGAGPTSSSLLAPVALAFDSSKNLWVVDQGNSRVLEFSPPFTSGMAASTVLGQVDLAHGAPNQGGTAAANTFNTPFGAAFDSSGNMWIADGLNNRVLEFEPPFVANMGASKVVGQMDFTHGLANQGMQAGTRASTTLDSPHAVSFDSIGKLFVSDSQNNRALVFAPPFSNGEAASVVIGQADFTSAVTATTASGVNFPYGVIAVPAP